MAETSVSLTSRVRSGVTRLFTRFFRRRWYRRANRYLWQDVLKHVGDLAGRRVLFVGCGTTSTAAVDLAERGADVWCADISPDLLGRLREHPFGSLSSRIHAVAGDAQRMPFADQAFDVVVGKAIVHHLDIPAFMTEIDRVTAPRAKLVFSEPLGENPLINLFRWLTPRLRDADEHPLRSHDLAVIERHCSRLDTGFQFLFSAVSFPCYLVGLTRVGDVFLRLGSWLDRGIFAVCPPARRFAWAVTLVGWTGRPSGEAGHE